MNIDTYRMLIVRNFPQVTIQTSQPITKGWDSFVLEVNDELIFRFPLREDVVEYLQKEIRLYQPFSELLYGAYSENEKFIEQGRAHSTCDVSRMMSYLARNHVKMRRM